MAYVHDQICPTIVSFKERCCEPFEQHHSLYLLREGGGRHQVKYRMLLPGLNCSFGREFPLLRTFFQMKWLGRRASERFRIVTRARLKSRQNRIVPRGRRFCLGFCKVIWRGQIFGTLPFGKVNPIPLPFFCWGPV